MCVCVRVQGVLSEMEEQARQLRAGLEGKVHALRQDLDRKDGHVQELTASLADLREQMTEVEANEQATTRRIGQKLLEYIPLHLSEGQVEYFNAYISQLSMTHCNNSKINIEYLVLPILNPFTVSFLRDFELFYL